MGVLKEFACAAHGEFEEMVNGDEIPACPHGCTPRFVTREIRTPTASRSARTSNTDRLTKDLAQQYNLPNIKVDKHDGKSVMENLRKGEKAGDFGAYWGQNVNLSEFQPTNALQSQNIPPVKPVFEGRYNPKDSST
jgi:hypothetical protein